AGLACIQNALGGVQAFAGVSSLRIVGNTKVTTTAAGFRPVADKREIGVVFPDRYKFSTVETGARPGWTPLRGFSRFNGNKLLIMNPRPRADAVAKLMQNVRRLFVQQMLMRLPRELSDVRFSERTIVDAGQERLVIDAFGPGGLAATLLTDRRTCVPIALQYT